MNRLFYFVVIGIVVVASFAFFVTVKSDRDEAAKASAPAVATQQPQRPSAPEHGNFANRFEPKPPGSKPAQ